MADEIVVLEGGRDDVYEILLLYPVVTPSTINGVDDANPSNCDFLKPSSDLPLAAQAILSTAEKAAIDDGTSTWQTFPFHKHLGLTNGQLAAQLQSVYTRALALYTEKYIAAFQHVGAKINAT